MCSAFFVLSRCCSLCSLAAPVPVRFLFICACAVVIIILLPCRSYSVRMSLIYICRRVRRPSSHSRGSWVSWGSEDGVYSAAPSVALLKLCGALACTVQRSAIQGPSQVSDVGV